MIKVLALAGAVALAAAAVACSGSSNKSSSTSAAPPAATTSAGAAQASATQTAGGQAAVPAANSAAAESGQPAKLNLNTATAQQFLTVPGVGDRFVREFMEYRPYTTILQFRRELGKYVSQDQVKEWEKYVFVPVDPNKADADTLQQIPGVDAGIANQLIAARPYASSDAFMAKLGGLVSADQAAAARGYLAGS